MRNVIGKSTLDQYRKSDDQWKKFTRLFGYPDRIGKLDRSTQGRIVGHFAGLCSVGAFNSKRVGNKYQTFRSKLAAIDFMHRLEEGTQLDYSTPDYELVVRGYQRDNSAVDRKEPVT